MAESAAASNVALLNALASLPKTLFGSTTDKVTSGGAITEQTMFSREAIDSLLRGIMEGTSGGSGFAQVAASQKAPGLYNSTTRGMLLNDFNVRAAGTVAEKTAPKTSTKGSFTESTKTPGVINNKGSLLALAALIGSSKTGRKYLEDEWDSLSKMLGGSAAAAGMDAAGVIDFADVASNPLAAFSGAGSVGFSGLDSVMSMFPQTALDSFAASSFGTAGGPLDVSKAIGEFDNYDPLASGVDAASAASTALDFGGFATDAALEEAMLLDSFNPEYLGMTDGFGTAGLGQLIQGDVGQAGVQAGMAAIPVAGPFLAGADALTGGAISEGPGAVVNDLLGGVEDMLGLGGSKVICTELCRQGLMSKHLYIAEATTNLKRLSPITLRGYHAIAIPVVHKMRSSRKLSEFLQPWVLDYSNEVLGYGSGIRGKFVRYILEPLCYVVGMVVGIQDYKSLYVTSAQRGVN